MSIIRQNKGVHSESPISKIEITQYMNFQRFLFIVLFLSGCGKKPPTDNRCMMNFSKRMFELVKYQKCNKEDLIQDFKDYIHYTQKLAKEGELHREQIAAFVPSKLEQANKVLCAKGCSATHWINGQCFIWNSNQRRKMQEISRRAKKEPEHCQGKYDKMKGADFYIDYDWKNTEKYKLWKSGQIQKDKDKLFP